MTSMRPAVVAVAVAGLVLAGCQSKSGTDSAETATSAPVASPTSAAPSAPADNGVAALPATEILERAKAALKGAESFRATGNAVDDGQRMKIDLKMRGKDVVGSVTIGKAKVELLSVGGKQFIRPNEKFWAIAGDPKKAPAIAEVIGSRWVKVPAKDKSLAGLFDVADMDEMFKPDGKVSKGTTKTVDGVETIGLVDDGADGGTLYVATVGEPYPIRVEPSNADDGAMAFSSFGKSFPELKLPAAGDVIDLQKLAQG